MAAAQSYTYSIPDWDGSDIEGGWSGVIQDPTGRKLLPKTLAQDCLGPGGKDMATLITEVQRQLGQISPSEDVIRQAPPSGSFELAPGTLYDFTQAAATTLTFTLGAAEDGKAAAHAAGPYPARQRPQARRVRACRRAHLRYEHRGRAADRAELGAF